jgi:hypothetical protein
MITFSGKREAILVKPRSDLEIPEFSGLCSRNRGIIVDVFTDYEDAIQWFYGD